MFRRQVFVLVVGLVLILPACSVPHASHSQQSGGDMTAASLTAFKDHVRPVLSHCGTCHNKSQAPKFMATDNEQDAHTKAVGLVDFDDISKSRLLVRVVDEEHNCGGDCVALGDNLLAALNKWKSVRINNRSSSTGKETIAKTLRKTTENLTWDIGEMLGSEYKEKVKVTLTVEPDTDNEVYILKNLQVRPDGLDVYLGTIKPLLNGASQSTTTFQDLNCKVPAVTTATQDSQLTVVANGANINPTDFDATNRLSLAFDDLRLAQDNDENCNDAEDATTDVADFATVRGILGANNACGSCHPGNGRDVFSTSDVLNQKSARILAVINGRDPNHNNNRDAMPIIQNMSQPNKDTVINYINSLEE